MKFKVSEVIQAPMLVRAFKSWIKKTTSLQRIHASISERGRVDPCARIVVTSNGTGHRWGKRKEPLKRLEFASSVAVKIFCEIDSGGAGG